MLTNSSHCWQLCWISSMALKYKARSNVMTVYGFSSFSAIFLASDNKSHDGVHLMSWCWYDWNEPHSGFRTCVLRYMTWLNGVQPGVLWWV
jgi:hypothetical protein